MTETTTPATTDTGSSLFGIKVPSKFTLEHEVAVGSSVTRYSLILIGGIALLILIAKR